MNKEIKKEIEEYVLKEIKHLKNLDRQQEGYDEITKSSIYNIDTLVDLLQKEDVNNNNLELEFRKIDSAEIKNNNDTANKSKEINLNAKRDKELKVDRWIKIGCETAAVVVPVIFYNGWMKKGFEFEETGTYCSNTFKNLISKFKPTK